MIIHNHKQCDAVTTELHHIFHKRRPDQLSARARQHIALCPECRGALLTFAGVIAPHLLDEAHVIDCAACINDLPAYLDLEFANPARAIEYYRQVWWHLWTCEDCSETYEISRSLLDDSQIPPIALPSAPQVRQNPLGTLIKQIRLLRSTVVLVFPTMQSHLGAARGSNDSAQVVYEDFDESALPRQITISIQEHPGATCSVTILVIPPIKGRAMLICGAFEREAQFQPDGRAHMHTIALSELIHSDGPDLEISIHEDA